MNKKVPKIISLSILIIIIFLELLPFGAVLNFGTPEGNIIRHTVSYFSLTPFGYANFGPLITAWLSVLSLIFLVIFCFAKKNILIKITRILICICFVTSIFPLFLGIRFYSVVGGIISVLLLAENIILGVDRN